MLQRLLHGDDIFISYQKADRDSAREGRGASRADGARSRLSDGALLTAGSDGSVRIYLREMFIPYEELLNLVPSRVTGRELTEDERGRYLPQTLGR